MTQVSVQLYCQNCGFIEAYFESKTYTCESCGKPARATGRVRKREGDNIVEYRNGVPVSRWLRAGVEKPKPEVLTSAPSVMAAGNEPAVAVQESSDSGVRHTRAS